MNPRLKNRVRLAKALVQRSAADFAHTKGNLFALVRSRRAVRSATIGNLHRKYEGAVVLHLYYTDAWPLFCKYLGPVLFNRMDIFITLPEAQKAFEEKVLEACPQAHVLVLPNRGRDVLPFLTAARLVDKLGYSFALKLHSKKSPHRTDGSDWLHDMLDALVPQTNEDFDRLRKTLMASKTAIIGPKGQYLSLRVNLEANGLTMWRILRRVVSRKTASFVTAHSADFGFFAGTMFWARMDAIRPITSRMSILFGFQPEKGQIDGTQAHALERLFCVLAEVRNKDIYETNGKSVTKIESYGQGVIPNWSDVYVGPKS